MPRADSAIASVRPSPRNVQLVLTFPSRDRQQVSDGFCRIFRREGEHQRTGLDICLVNPCCPGQGTPRPPRAGKRSTYRQVTRSVRANKLNAPDKIASWQLPNPPIRGRYAHRSDAVVLSTRDASQPCAEYLAAPVQMRTTRISAAKASLQIAPSLAESCLLLLGD
jgi:hypothetical protein